MTARVVTISASYGAGGSIIGPAVAERLQVPFLDRAIPAAVAHSLAVPVRRALAHDNRADTGLGRLISKMAAAVVPMGAMPAMSAEQAEDEDLFRTTTEQVIRGLAGGEGGVVLGRAGAIVLAGHPSALHVRLDGPRQARLARALANDELPIAGRQTAPTSGEKVVGGMVAGGTVAGGTTWARQVPRETSDTAAKGPSRAVEILDESDRAREAYVRHFYRADPHDARLYHLSIDSTVIALETCVEIIVMAANALVVSPAPSLTAPGTSSGATLQTS